MRNYSQVGSCFYFNGISCNLRTSTVKSVYICNTEQDKLVLPSDFPDKEYLDFSNIELKSGDILFATLNSVYALRDIQEKNNEDPDNV